MLKSTMETSSIAASAEGMKIRFPESIHKPIIASSTPQPPSNTESGTIPRVKRGKYPIQSYGAKYALNGGYRKAKATPTRKSR